ncbi:hypothetical protein [Deinococcus aestuarii]|uniref:hypothetical protein n=1 Tax=Deinococcus aestuarii TaxID=2774531 RepID=UPI001C0C2949|nr:hypothetical protein [Deinococcus aestuarii]
MRLVELRRELVRHGVSLAVTAEGKLRPSADARPPRELVEAMREHRAALLRQVEEGRLPDGRLDVDRLAAEPGHCGCCARWQGPDAYGDGMCPLGRAAHGWADGSPTALVLTPSHHGCGAHSGQGWQVRA